MIPIRSAADVQCAAHRLQEAAARPTKYSPVPLGPNAVGEGQTSLKDGHGVQCTAGRYLTKQESKQQLSGVLTTYPNLPYPTLHLP